MVFFSLLYGSELTLEPGLDAAPCFDEGDGDCGGEPPPPGDPPPFRGFWPFDDEDDDELPGGVFSPGIRLLFGFGTFG